MVGGQCLLSTWTGSLLTQAKTAEWDEILSSSQRSARRSLWWLGVNVDRRPACCVSGVRCCPSAGYNRTVRRVSAGVAAARMLRDLQHVAKGRAAWKIKKAFGKCAVIHQASQSRDFSPRRDQSVGTNKVLLAWFPHLKCIDIYIYIFCLKLVCS